MLCRTKAVRASHLSSNFSHPPPIHGYFQTFPSHRHVVTALACSRCWFSRMGCTGSKEAVVEEADRGEGKHGKHDSAMEARCLLRVLRPGLCAQSLLTTERVDAVDAGRAQRRALRLPRPPAGSGVGDERAGRAALREEGMRRAGLRDCSTRLQPRDATEPPRLLSFAGQLSVAQLLLSNPDVEPLEMLNARDVHGCTPLHHAVRYGYPEIARYFIENGASTLPRAKVGRAAGRSPAARRPTAAQRLTGLRPRSPQDGKMASDWAKARGCVQKCSLHPPLLTLFLLHMPSRRTRCDRCWPRRSATPRLSSRRRRRPNRFRLACDLRRQRLATCWGERRRFWPLFLPVRASPHRSDFSVHQRTEACCARVFRCSICACCFGGAMELGHATFHHLHNRAR